MKNKSTKHISIADKMILIGIGLGVLYWFVESAIHVLIFHHRNFVQQVFISDPHEIWTRTLVMGILVIFGVYGQVIMTKRKRAEESLKESETRYRGMVEGAHDMIQSVGLDGSFKFVNRACLRILGYTEQELPNLKMWDIISPDSLKHCQEQFSKVISGEAVTDIQATFVAKDGRQILVEGDAFPRYLEEKVIATHSFFRDITERKRAEEESRESEERYRALFERSLYAVYVHDFEGRFLDANEATLNLLGYAKEELLSLNLSSLLGEEQLRVALKDHEEIKQKGFQKEPTVYKLRRKDGDFVWVETEGSLIYQQGKPYAIQGIVRDVTERKRADEEIRRVAGDLRRLIDTANAPIFGIDSKGLVNEWNQKVTEMTGYSKDEVLGRNLVEDFITEDYKEPVKEVLDRALKGEETANFEFPLYAKKGGRILILLNSTTRRDVSGNVSGVVGIGQDITELDAYRTEMDTLVEKRTRELTQAKQAAEVANRTKSEFLANMSHELRTPLNSIIGFSQVMLDGLTGSMTDDQKEYLNDIVESGRHLLSLINDILDLSKVEAGKMELELSGFSMKDLLEESLVMFKERAAKHHITLESDIPADIGDITADERKTKQVIFNLLSNATKFTPDGGRVGIVGRRKDKELQITVWDTGIGIAKKDISKLFESFQQLESALIKKTPGTGLGLSLSKKFVELQGGRIWVESEKGKGSRFTFTIPLKGEK